MSLTCALPECSNEFVPKKPWGRYCSARCGRIASRRRQWDRERAAEGKPPLGRDDAHEQRVCPVCSTSFLPNPVKFTYQVFCSVRCRRRGHYRRKYQAAIGPRPCQQCGAIMATSKPGRKYCGPACRSLAHQASKKAMRVPRRRRLKCKWCSGDHQSAACTNREGVTVKQYGTMGPNREYVPPPGVRVTVRHLPPSVFGEDLKSQVGGRFGR